MRPDTLALIAAAVPAWAFTLIYLNEYRYVKPTQESVHLIGFTLMVALILSEELARRIWVDLIPRDWHQVFVGVTVALAATFLWQRLYMLLRHQVLPRLGRKRARAREFQR